jgi:hypothetical protein
MTFQTLESSQAEIIKHRLISRKLEMLLDNEFCYIFEDHFNYLRVDKVLGTQQAQNEYFTDSGRLVVHPFIQGKRASHVQCSGCPCPESCKSHGNCENGIN